jgi:hypothetical protein
LRAGNRPGGINPEAFKEWWANLTLGRLSEFARRMPEQIKTVAQRIAGKTGWRSITIENGVARIEVSLTQTTTLSQDLKVLAQYLKSQGAKTIVLDTQLVTDQTLGRILSNPERAKTAIRRLVGYEPTSVEAIALPPEIKTLLPEVQGRWQITVNIE